MTLWTIARQAPLGFSRQEYWSGLPLSPPEDFMDTGEPAGGGGGRGLWSGMGKGLSIFCPQFLKIALFDIIFLADGFAFQHFEYIISLPWSIHRFWWDISSILLEFTGMAVLSSISALRFSIFSFQHFTSLCMTLPCLSYLELIETLGYVDWYHSSYLGCFLPLFFEYFALPILLIALLFCVC